ncbi:putative potassium channel, voltage-dependent, EAG/ELK/ERG, ankyrin repeat-containing [Medicago truncatula]|uniref:Potassium channel n=1 Tax=Medicago truncatula TaxID=3880 RepID=G7KG18_MEDTR|nr:potassium channel SKOR isoform X1 [Medicago truncatula]AES99205.2 potassium outward rectifying channel protein [Medicago truncatula]RHN56891.1 putative potassium channel, voltage-dependent, EAG/ELK/ERG, ankyrin repeat-containing [Medicago truncatula]
MKMKEEEDEGEKNRINNQTATCSGSSSLTPSSSSDEREYQVQDLRDKLKSSRGSRFNLIEKELGLKIGWRKFSRRTLLHEFVINPLNRWYRAWLKFILLWAVYSSFFTPMEFGFFRGLPENLFILDIVGQIAFLVDIVLQFFVAYRDSQTYRMVYKRTPIALRYLKSTFVIDLLGCMPWDLIYKACGRREEVRYLLWIRLYRAERVVQFFRNLEKDIRVNYIIARIVKLLVVELYCTHTAACIFYYLATTLPESQEGYTWIGSLKLGDYAYSKFREIDIWKRYTTSLYFAIVTMATVGYGDIHAVNLREMIFIMIYVSFDMVLGAYLIGNMTALIVKGSKTEKFRDRMTDLMKYMNRNKLHKDIREQIKGHVRLQFESSYTDAAVLQDIPISIRSKISESLYSPYIKNVSLFSGCSSEFINQIVTRLHEEFFLPGEVIMQQGYVVDQLYFVCDGVLEEVGIADDGSEETVALLERNSSFGEISILCNIPQPHTVRVCELCRVLRIDKQSFSNILDIYFYDGKKVLDNLLEGKESIRGKQLESDITFHIGKLESELALKVNRTAFDGDLYQLKSLIRAGADPKKTDYDGRSPLHLAACRGYEDITLLLIHERVDMNVKDNFGNTPLLEAVKNGHDRIASLLVREGASLKIDDGGSFLCSAVARGDSDYLKRLLSNGMDANLKDYDYRTPLHVAASEGLIFMAKLLLEAGASVFTKDRWGNTPLDEARMSGNKNLIKLLEDAKSAQLTEFPFPQEITDKVHPKKCTVFPFHPWDPKEQRRNGIVLWIPHTIQELIITAAEQIGFSSDACILSEDAGKIIDISMIKDDQKLYLVNETH